MILATAGSSAKFQRRSSKPSAESGRGDSRGSRVRGVSPWQAVKSRASRPGIGGVDESGGGHPPAPRQGIGCPYFELTPRAPPMSTVSRIPPVRSITSRLRGAIPSNSGDGRATVVAAGERSETSDPSDAASLGLPRRPRSPARASTSARRAGAVRRRDSARWPRCRRWVSSRGSGGVGQREYSPHDDDAMVPDRGLPAGSPGVSTSDTTSPRCPSRTCRSRRSRKRVVSQALVPLGAAMAVLAVGGCGR